MTPMKADGTPLADSSCGRNGCTNVWPTPITEKKANIRISDTVLRNCVEDRLSCKPEFSFISIVCSNMLLYNSKNILSFQRLYQLQKLVIN